MVLTRGKVYVVGVGMTKVMDYFYFNICLLYFVLTYLLPQFYKPGKSDKDYPELAKEAVMKALEDARIAHDDVKSCCVGYVYGKYCNVMKHVLPCT